MHTIAIAIERAHAALLARLEPVCRTCDDLACLDCAQDVAHDRCVRPCTHCTPGDVDWDQSWEITAIITELRGLDRLDRAVAAGA
ncbi:hypothetical protein [Agilicoccus flavus]|uniref:hypothetical protein n=1 Tax=Agilicoccus flavus TaxID=2775968 RepID=UPI001CF6FC13|nr:hypothetical protein [Agilicoccus flavus]